MATVFACSACGAVVTNPVERLEDATQIRLGDGEAAVPQGRFAVADPKEWSSFGGWFMLNLADAVGTREHPEVRRLSGCCGPSGLNGKNKVCAQGHEIGTECSDCWMPHALMLDPKSVVVKDQG